MSDFSDNRPEAEILQESFNTAINQLYLNGDRDKPLVPEGTLIQKEWEYNKQFLDGLIAIRQACESQKAEADILEAKAKQHYSAHLSNSELQAAALRKPFIEKDAKTLDTPTLIENARQAAMKNDKVSAFAYLEVLPDASNVSEQRQLDDVRETLKQTLIPPNLRNASQRALDMKYHAEVERIAAKSVLHDLSGKPAGTYNPFPR